MHLIAEAFGAFHLPAEDQMLLKASSSSLTRLAGLPIKTTLLKDSAPGMCTSLRSYYGQQERGSVWTLTLWDLDWLPQTCPNGIRWYSCGPWQLAYTANSIHRLVSVLWAFLSLWFQPSLEQSCSLLYLDIMAHSMVTIKTSDNVTY